MESPLTSTENRIETLRKCLFLRGLKENVLSDLAIKAETLRVASGETILTRGEEGSAMYFIISGKAISMRVRYSVRWRFSTPRFAVHR